MVSLGRKRKGTKFSSFAGSHLSDGGGDGHGHGRLNKKTCRGPEKPGSPAGAGAGVVMTAPTGGSTSCDIRVRGLKRKLGCIDPTTRIGRRKRLEKEYELGHEIGKGKFGSVRLCRSRASGEECACKTLPKGTDELVHREVEIMQHLSGHPGVVTLKAVFEDADCFHIVMELCTGGRLLDQMVRERIYTEQRAANLVKDLVSVIKYCHEMGVVHRDIKPENILLTTSGKVKLADFGLAVRLTSGQKLSSVTGSPAYVAPEVLSGHYSEKVDVWGAGVLLHALLVGVLPFQGDSLQAVFEAIKRVELDFHSGMWESISELARDLIGRMLSRDVSTRMTAAEILRHPWVLFYTESPSKHLPVGVRVGNNGLTTRTVSQANVTINGSSSWESLSRKIEEQDECGFVDAVAAAISRVRISEPKRSKLCVPAIPVQQECSPNKKANLCTAF